MKPLSLLLPLCILLSGCSMFSSSAPAPRAQVRVAEPPSSSNLVGTYRVVEEVASGLPLEKSPVRDTTIVLNPRGRHQLSSFPEWGFIEGPQPYPRKLYSEEGRWDLNFDKKSGAYTVTLHRAEKTDREITARVVDAGAGHELVVDYPTKSGHYFMRLRRVDGPTIGLR